MDSAFPLYGHSDGDGDIDGDMAHTVDDITPTSKESRRRPRSPSPTFSPSPLAVPACSNPTLFGTSFLSGQGHVGRQATSLNRLPKGAIRPRKASIAERRSGTHGLPPRIQISSAAHAGLLSATSLPASVAAPHSLVSDQSPVRHHPTLQQHQSDVFSTLLQPPDFERGSAPINIPARQKNTSRPTTPLTAREEKAGFEFPFHDITPKKSQISQSLRPTYHQHKRPERNCNHNLTPPRRQDSDGAPTVLYSEQTLLLSTSSSSLSPTTMPSTLPSPKQQNVQHIPGQKLKLPTLPRFHPANYQSPSSSSQTTPTKLRMTPLSRRPRSPMAHNRQTSDAQQRLYQYQREVIKNASRVATLNAPQTIDKPPTPQILPCGSPGTGPATPLMLEDSEDYMTGGLRRSSSAFQEDVGRDAVDRMIHNEHQRGSSMGMHSPRSSPAVSPAGGPY